MLEEYIIALKQGNTNSINQLKEEISNSLYSVLPANGEFYFYCQNVTNGGQVIEKSIINPISKLPEEAVGINYLVSEIQGNFEPYIFHTLVWLEGV